MKLIKNAKERQMGAESQVRTRLESPCLKPCKQVMSWAKIFRICKSQHEKLKLVNS